MQLTDDEILYVAHTHGAPWPGFLPSVSWESSSRGAAAFRGLRSLLVRELAEPATSDFVINAELSESGRAFVEAAAVIGSHPATLENINLFVGHGRLYAISALGEAAMNVVSPAGIHELLPIDQPAEKIANDTIRALWESPQHPGGKAGIMFYGKASAGEPAFWVAPGRVVEGVLAQSPGDSARFVLDAQQDTNVERAGDLIRAFAGL